VKNEDKTRLIRKCEFFSRYNELQAIFVGIREDKETLQKGLESLKRQVEGQ
jgi:hypothetical protein